MKKLWNKWTDIALVKRILVGLILGAILGIAVPGATGIAILGDVFVSALKAIAPLLVFFLVISSLCNAGKSHGGVIKTVIILYMFSTVLAAVIAVFASMAFPVKLTLATAATTDAAAPQGIVEVLNNLLLNLVANPVSSLVNANYVGILMWAILLGLAFRAANNMTQNVLMLLMEFPQLLPGSSIWLHSVSSVLYSTQYLPMAWISSQHMENCFFCLSDVCFLSIL